MVNILPGAPRQDPMERMLALFRVGMSVRQQKLQAEQNAAELKLRSQQLMQQAKAQEEEAKWTGTNALLGVADRLERSGQGGDIQLPDGTVINVPNIMKQIEMKRQLAEAAARGGVEGTARPIPPEIATVVESQRAANPLTTSKQPLDLSGSRTPNELQIFSQLFGRGTQNEIATADVPEFGLRAGQAYDPRSASAQGAVWQEGQQNFRSKEARAAAQERWSQLSPAQQLAETRQLSKQYLDATQAPRIVQTQYKVMEDTMKGITSGEFKDLNAPTQVIVNTFNKIIDPSSVVRESEYARSPDGQALLDSLVGKAAALARGGPGLTPGNLREFVRLAKVFADNSVKSMESEKQRVLDIADAYKIPRNHIVAGEKTNAPSKVEDPLGIR